MKISIFTSYTNPDERMDPWKESMACYEEYADEVVVVGQNWPNEFSFDHIGKTFQEGFDKSKGDWVIKFDIDTMFHEKDKKKLLYFLKKYENYPAISAPKFQIFTPERFHVKTNMTFILNKKKFPNIVLNGGGDLCDPMLDGQLLNEYNCPTVPIPFWNYDSVFKTKNVISEDRARFARAWYAQFGNYGSRGGPTREEAFEAWFEMVKNKYKKHIYKLTIEKHPKFIKKSLLQINKSQFGYNAFGLKDTLERELKDYISSYKDRYYGNLVRKLKYEKLDTTYTNI